MTSQDPIVIAGGGVGELTAALALAKVGRASLVLERAPAFREVGAGLQLAPNACRILRDLGVLPLLKEMAVAPDHIRIRRGADGADLAKISLKDMETRYGRPISPSTAPTCSPPCSNAPAKIPRSTSCPMRPSPASSRTKGASPSLSAMAANTAAPPATP